MKRFLRSLFAASLVVFSICMPGQAQPYDPPEGSPAYWVVPAYKNFPPKGPADARGIIFWSHGVSAKNVQWSGRPARFMLDFAKDGWDVIKINRDNLRENGWIPSGIDHVEHVVKLAKEAKSEGYRYVITGGQSYGGAISLEAAVEPGLFFGVIATAPGHGSDACGSGDGFARLADNLPDQLESAIEKTKAPRIMVSQADGDDCVGFNDPSAQVRRALLRSANSFVFLDKTMPVRGHGAAGTRQFRRWYGKCLVAFFDPDTQPGGNENYCKAPSPVPRFLFPAGYEMPRPSDGEKSLIGAWSGKYDLERGQYVYERDVCVVVEMDMGRGIRAKYALGGGASKTLSMGTRTRWFDKSGDSFVYRGRKEYQIRLTPNAALTEIGLVTSSSSGNKQWTTTLRRGC